MENEIGSDNKKKGVFEAIKDFVEKNRIKLVGMTSAMLIAATLSGCGVPQMDYDRLDRQNDKLLEEVQKFRADSEVAKLCNELREICQKHGCTIQDSNNHIKSAMLGESISVSGKQYIISNSQGVSAYEYGLRNDSYSGAEETGKREKLRGEIKLRATEQHTKDEISRLKSENERLSRKTSPVEIPSEKPANEK